MPSSRCWLQLGLLAVLLATLPAWAGQVITVGGDTGKSIADGLAQLHAGDTLRIQPGTYHEIINVPCDDVTIEGTGPGVILEGAVTLTAKDFTPAADRPGVYTWQLPANADSRIPAIFYHGQPLVYAKASLHAAKQAWCFFVDQQSHRLEVVLDGKGFPDGATLVVPTLDTLVEAGQRRQVTVRGLQIYRAVGCGIGAGAEARIENNLVEQVGLFGVVAGEKSVITGNTMRFCNGPGVLLGGNMVRVENNLVVCNGIQHADYITWCGTETKTNGISYSTFQQNWIMDHPKGGLVKVDGQTAMNDGKPVVNTWVLNGGLWPDVDCYNNNYIDNCIARMSHAGIYIEYNADRNVIMANDVQDCAMGITIREGCQNLVTRNWVWDHECLGWGAVNKEGFAGFGPGYTADGTPLTKLYVYDGKQSDPATQRVVEALGSSTWGQQMDDGLCLWHSFPQMGPPSHDNVMSHNLVQVCGVAVSVPLGDHRWPTAQERQQTPQLPEISNQLSDNFYTLSAQAKEFALLGRTIVKSFADYRQLTAWDANSRVGNFTPSVLGLEALWTIPALAVDTNTPVSMLYDPSLETLSVLSHNEPLFWHGDIIRDDWVDAVPVTRYLRDDKLAHSGNWCISVSNLATEHATYGWTSSAIPVKPGTTMGINLWLAADNIKAAKNGEGVRASIRFTDVTGHQVGERDVIGDGVHPELLTGTYKYTNLDDQAVVPAGACWMTVFLGADPADGRVRFDDIHLNMRNPLPPRFAVAK
jgi:parallel beta-helix repeat protein